MKNPNAYGSVVKLAGTRRRPWAVRVTTGFTMDPVMETAKQLRQYIGYYATRAEAMQALADYNKDPFSLDSLRVTFRECYDEASKDFSAARAHNYRSGARYLEPIMDLPIRSIKATQMQACIDSCKTTQQREIKTVCRKVYDYAMRAEIVDRDPSLYLKSNTVDAEIVRDVYTSDQIRDLFDHKSDWWAKVTLLLLYTGMRTKELRDLDPERDIDIDNRMINIRQGKNKNSIRQIPIHDMVLPIAKDWRDAPRTFSHNGYIKIIKNRYGRLAHDSRHTFTSKLRDSKVDLLLIQLLLGHAPKTITERVYTHVTQDELREAINKLDYGVRLL